jgi:hypothetical protein
MACSWRGQTHGMRAAGDGFLTAAEFQGLYEQLFPKSQKWEQAFQSMDLEGNGKVGTSAQLQGWG